MSRSILADLYRTLPEWKDSQALDWLEDGVVFDEEKGVITRDIQRLRPGSVVRREWEIYRRALGSVASTVKWTHVFSPSCLDWKRYERSHTMREVLELLDATKTLRLLPQEPWILTPDVASALDGIDHTAQVRVLLQLGVRKMTRRLEENMALVQTLRTRGKSLLAELKVHIAEITAECGVLTDADFIRAWGLVVHEPALGYVRAKLYALGAMLGAILPERWERIQDMILQLHLNKAAGLSSARVPPQLFEEKEAKTTIATHKRNEGKDVQDTLFELLQLLFDAANEHVVGVYWNLKTSSDATEKDLVKAWDCARVAYKSLDTLKEFNVSTLAGLGNVAYERLPSAGKILDCVAHKRCNKRGCLLARIVTYRRLLECW